MDQIYYKAISHAHIYLEIIFLYLICKLNNVFPKLISDNFLITYRTLLLFFQPFIEACWMKLMWTSRYFFEFLIFCKIFKAYWARSLVGITLFHPHFFWNFSNFWRCEAFANFPIIFLQLNNLFVGHIINIRSSWIYVILLTLFDCSLEKSFFFCCSAVAAEHAIHHHLHHDISFSISSFLLLHLHC